MDNVMAFTFDGGNTFSSYWDSTTNSLQFDKRFLATSTLASYIWAQSGGDGAFGYNEGDMFIELARLIGFADPQSFETNFIKLLKLAADGLSFEEALAAMPNTSCPKKAASTVHKKATTSETRARLEDYLSRLPKQTVYTLAIRFWLNIMQRSGEWRALTWEDVNLEKGSIINSTMTRYYNKNNNNTLSKELQAKFLG